MEAAVGHPDFPFQIGVAVPLKEPTPGGLTTNAEPESLNLIEDKLVESLCVNHETVFVMAITNNGMREFVFYAKEWKPEYFENKVKEVNKDNPSYEFQFMMQKDPKWDTFTHFTK